MNNLLELKGSFDQKKRLSHPSAGNLPKLSSEVKVDHLNDLLNQLLAIKQFWENSHILKNCLFSIYYIDIMAKSNRVKSLFTKNTADTNSTVVGAKYTGTDTRRHVITHCVTHDNLQDSIEKLGNTIHIIKTLFGERITGKQIDDINKNIIELPDSLTKTKFVGIVVDCYYVEKFNIDTDVKEYAENSIITLYNTGMNTTDLLNRVGIKDFLSVREIDNTTVLLYPHQLKILRENAPFLISMSVSDMSEFSKDDFKIDNKYNQYIPAPQNEPIIGVIDTLFDKKVYFSDWVEVHNMIDTSKFELNNTDYNHGTWVSSIIVDGPTLNPALNDNCGRFKVRHFGVTTGGKFSSFTILQSIKKIIESNKDIKVWNLSLGSALEINPNFISPEAAIMDQIQFENDVIFIIAGTNKSESNPNSIKIGAPADSINSIVVNSVDEQGKPTDYSREGIVLSFFNKPDISYYGGTKKNPILACNSDGACYVAGTSFAAPWISRKVAYLIHKIGLSREVAKALLVDSTIQWKENIEPSKYIGFGVVPIKIEDIIKSKDDEIKFVMQDISELYDTYTYKIPVPIYKDKQPYIAKATLCYFPKCNRNQGVDYTNTEMDLHFGRLKQDGKGIDTINDNRQNDEEENYLKERKARQYFRKWDNVKHICENFKERNAAKKIFGNGLWGISIKTIERLSGNDGKEMRFGIVITLKEIKGVNRIQEFIQMCSLKAWLVNEISVENRIDIYNKAEAEIKFEENKILMIN